MPRALTRLVVASTAAALLGLAPLASADAATHVRTDNTVTTPDTPKNNTRLPLIHTKRKSDSIKPNILNARPVCNAWEDYRTVIYTITDDFTQVGSVETKNTSDAPIPLTQNLSKTQTITLSIQGDFGGSFSGVNASIKPSASYSLAWTAGQQIGPYQVPSGYTGKAVYGFRTIKFKGTQQRCLLNGTWSDTWAYTGTAPISNAVELKLYRNNADA